MKLFSMLRYKNMAEVGCLKDGHFQNLSCEGKLVLHGDTDHIIDKGNYTLEKGTLKLNGAGNVNRSAKTTDRYYLDEYFLQRPGINANIDQQADVEVQRALNRNFEALGTNMTTALCTFSTTHAGITLTTATADEDQAIIHPHLDAASTAWAGVLWGTENQVEWECAITPAAIDNQKVWAGLKLTMDQLSATDADQAYFKFQSDADNSTALADTTNWHFIYSVGGADHITQLPIVFTAATTYHLKIVIDSARQVSIFVNGLQYSVATVAGATGGTLVAEGTGKSAALTDNVDLIPYIGIENGAAAAEVLHVHYQAMNRILFE